MRSEMIFRAQEKVANRYRLCHAASKVSRCLHYYSTTTQDAISDAFVRIAHVPCLAQPTSLASFAPAHRYVEDSHDMPSSTSPLPFSSLQRSQGAFEEVS